MALLRRTAAERALRSVVLVAVISFACSPAEPKVYGTLPPFQLTDQTGAAFGSAELSGRPWIANFVFTRCTTVCPVFTAQMAEVQATVKAEGIDVRLVSFTVDPLHDTPERLADFATRHGADPAIWRFLTGKPEAIQAAVVEGLKVSAGPAGPDADPATIFHGSHFVLVDGALRIRGYYDSAEEARVEAMVRDVRTLTR